MFESVNSKQRLAKLLRVPPVMPIPIFFYSVIDLLHSYLNAGEALSEGFIIKHLSASDQRNISRVR